MELHPSTNDEAAVVYAPTVEGLFRALGPLDEGAKERVRALGVDPERRLAPGYPLAVWVSLLRLGADLFAPELSVDEALHALGRRFLDGYGETLMGRAMMLALRVIGPTAALARLSHQFGTAGNYFTSRVVLLGDREALVEVHPVTWPGWYFGLLERALEQAGAHDVQVSVAERQGLSAGFRVRWS